MSTIGGHMSAQGIEQTCYRHPNTPTGIVCQRCDRPICTQCMKQASVGFHCPECVKSNSQKVVTGPAVFAGVQPYVTMGLIAINVIVWLLERASPTPFDGNAWNVAIDQGEWWRMITGGFLHSRGVLWHIFMNMFALWNLGRIFERMLGARDYLVLYMGSLLAGSLGVVVSGAVFDGGAGRGASGAIFGLIGALVVAYRSRGISIQQSGLMPTLVINAVISFLPGISLAGHLGGFLGGLALAYIFFYARDDLAKINKHAVTGAAVALSLAFFAAGILIA